MRTGKITLALLAALTLASACTRRPLDIAGGALRIELHHDWSVPYERTDPEPYHYAVLMYDAADGKLIYEDFCGAEGGRIRAVAGDYTVLVHDMNNSVLLFEGRNDIQTLRACTPDVPDATAMQFAACKIALATKVSESGLKLKPVKGNPGYEYGRIIREPDMLQEGSKADVNVPVLALSDTDLVIPVDTRNLLPQARLTITGVRHTEFVSSVRVYVTNLSTSRYVHLDQPDNIPCTESFLMTKIEENRITGTFNHFGRIPGQSNTAYVVVTDTGGGQYLFVVDVTPQMEEQGDNADMRIEIDYDIPDPGEGGAGFQPDVDNWDVIWYDIPIGYSAS